MYCVNSSILFSYFMMCTDCFLVAETLPGAEVKNNNKMTTQAYGRITGIEKVTSGSNIRQSSGIFVQTNDNNKAERFTA